MTHLALYREIVQLRHDLQSLRRVDGRVLLSEVDEQILHSSDRLWRAMSDEERALAPAVAARGWADSDPDPDEITANYSEEGTLVRDPTPTTWPPPPDTLVPVETPRRSGDR